MKKSASSAHNSITQVLVLETTLVGSSSLYTLHLITQNIKDM